MYEAAPARPFRFMYLSAEGITRDPTKKPLIMPDYNIMRVVNWDPVICSGSYANVSFAKLVQHGAHSAQISYRERRSRGLHRSARRDC